MEICLSVGLPHLHQLRQLEHKKVSTFWILFYNVGIDGLNISSSL